MNWIDIKLYRFPRWRKWRGLPEPMTPEQSRQAREAMKMLGHMLEKSAFVRNVSKDYDSPLGEAASTVRIAKPTRYVSKDA